MKINEKWLLFSISTFTVLFGIAGHLLNGPVNTDDSGNLIINDTFEYFNDGRYLVELTLNEGFIEFDSDVYEYWIDVVDFENLEVYPVVSSLFDSYKILKEDDSIKIIVTKADESFKEYTIHVNELNTDNEEVIE